LRRIASLAGSSATLEEILKYSLQELANLFSGRYWRDLLNGRSSWRVALHRESTYGISSDISNTFIQILWMTSIIVTTVSGSQKPFLSGRLSTDRQVFAYLSPLATVLLIESAIVVPLVVREHSIGELILGSFKNRPLQFL